MRIENVKIFLEQNKIFFDTIAAIALSIMAVVVSLSSNSIQSRQADIQGKEVQPQFVLQNVVRESFASSSVDSINVLNHGGVFRDLKVTPFLFYEISLFQKNRYAEVQIPVDLYYTFSLSLSGKDGLVYKVFSDPDKYSKYLELESEFSSMGDIYSISSSRLNLQKYVKVEYQDIFGKYHSEYYIISNVSGSALLDNAEGERLFGIYDKQDRLNFDQHNSLSVFESALNKNRRTCSSLNSVISPTNLNLTTQCLRFD